MGGWSSRLLKHKCPGGLLPIADEWSLTSFPAIKKKKSEVRITFAKYKKLCKVHTNTFEEAVSSKLFGEKTQHKKADNIFNELMS